MPIAFKEVGVFGGLGGETLSNPTSLQFGPDGRLYVSEQNGTINAFTVAISDGKYVATAQEVLKDASGNEVVKSIQNHFDDGSESGLSNRQVTGIVVAGTAEIPVLYISSSNPDIAQNGDKNLDTNSGVVSRATWNPATGAWDVVDLVRGLPRSEENHAVNGMLLNEDGTKLLLQVGGFTNNGAPSGFFSYTNEYALSGAILELDLVALDALPDQIDPQGGQGNTPRTYKYDLPTLDDPNVANAPVGLSDAEALAAGFRENSGGMDLAGPWGGNDGLNMAILPNDAPLRLYADGLRNAYDLARTPDGKIYTVDNGSNGGLGGAPSREGVGVDLDGDGITNEAIGTPNSSSYGEGEPLFLIEEGGFYQHSNPVRSNQNMAWTVYNNSGNPDTSLTVNQVADISALVPAQLIQDGKITEGFLIDPSKFAGLEGLDPNDPADRALIDARLFQSGQGVDRDTAASVAITTVGSSTNGIVAYDSNGQAFNGVLDGKLFVTQFNDNITLLNINADGTALVPVKAEGPDGIFGTADDVVQDADGILPVANNQLGVALGNPLDVTMGPGGTLWVAEIGSNEITVLAPSDLILPGDTDGDDDGIPNVTDPFMRDAANGTGVQILPGQVFLWDFDPNQDGNLPGPDGFGGGLTGVMINKTTDFEQFLQADYSGPGTENVINLDNMKFITAAGGGNTVVENVSAGDASGAANSAEFLFHTGVQFAANVGTATIKWSMFNPAADIDGAFQQIGGYIGTGDQSNFLKLVAIEGLNGGDFQIVLENNDQTVSSQLIDAGGVFEAAQIPTQPPGKIFLELLIDVIAGTAVPKITYDTNGGQNTATGAAIDLAGTAVLEAIRGDYTVQGQASGLAVGLYSSSVGQTITDVTDTFGVAFDDIEITATEAALPPDAVDDAAQTGVNAALIIPVAQLLANDSDPNDDTLTVTGVSNPVNGTVSLSNGVVTFTPAADFEGAASFDYAISDGAGGTDVATVDVTVADEVILYRVNAGGGAVAAIDGGPAWVSDATLINSAGPVSLTGATANTYSNAITDTAAEVEFLTGQNAADASVVPWQVYVNERSDNTNDATKLTYTFDVEVGKNYKISLFYTENWVNVFGFAAGTSGGSKPAGQSRQFDVAVEGQVPEVFNGLNPLAEALALQGGTLPTSNGASDAAKQPYLGVALQRDYVYTATDDKLTLTFDHEFENPKINAIQIAQVGGAAIAPKPVVNIVSGDAVVSEDDGVVQVSILTSFTVPANETVDVNFTIEPVGGATPGAGGDYVYNSSSATFGGGVYTDTKSIAGSSSDLTIPIQILADDLPEGAETFKLTILSVSPNATLGSNSEATVTIAANDTVIAPGDVLFRINAGGPEVAANDGGPAWTADQSAVTANGEAALGAPSPYLVDRGVAGDDVTYGDATPTGPGTNATGAPDALFTTERFSTLANPDNIGYAFDVPNGSYIVNLYFDELFFGAAGARVFDVQIEGGTVLDDFDPYAAAGNTNNTIKQSFVVPVTDGVLNLEFLKGSVNNPHIAAIEIIDNNGAPGLPQISIAAPTPADVQETGDTGFTTLTFPVTFDAAPAESVTVSYTVDINGVGTTGALVLGTANGVITVDVANDDAANGADSVTVTLTGVTAGGVAAALNPAAVSASATVTEDDDAPVVDPDDIDADNILNTDDPFAYDGDNGLGRVLTAGGEFTQDFNTPTEDPFDADGGFTGILVNPDFNPPGASETDPYGDRTVEEKVTIANGALSITSSLEDSNQSGTGLGNLIRDNYQSGMDVSNVQKFEVVTRASSADWVGVLGTNGFAQFGVKVGAGGLDDFIKLVVSDRGTGATAIQLAHNGTLVGGETNVNIPGGITLDASTTYEVRLIVDRSVTLIPDTATAVAGEVSGIVEFFDGAGVSMGTVETGPRYVLTTSAFAAAMTNANPLTGGTGGIAYGVSITDGTGPNPNTNQFTADFDFLTIRSLDAAPATPVVSIGDAGSVTENGDVDATVLSFPVTFDVAPTGAVTVEYALDIAGTVTTGLQAVIPAAGGAIAVEVPSDAVANGDEAVTVTLTGVISGTADLGGQVSGSGTVTEDDAGYTPPVDDLFGTPVEISNDRGTPSDGGVLSIGANVVTATQEGESGENGVRDRDYFTFTVPDGAVLTGIILTGYDIGDDDTAEDGFMGIQLGGEITVDPITGAPDAGTSPLLGAIVYAPGDVGANLLALMAAGGEVGTGTGFVLPGFEAALTGQVSVWLNQGAGPNAPTLTFVVEQQGEISIADAPTIAETGDDAQAVDTLLFPLTGPADATVTLDYTVDGVAQTPLEVTFDATGAATLPVAVAQDDAINADEVIVELTGVSSALYAIGAAASATGTVTEDDGDGIDPNDIDGDGLINIVDPAFDDASNGMNTVLSPGAAILLDFETPGSDPFAAGFTGLNVNPDLTTATTAADPYGAQSTAGVSIADGLLKITTSNGDSFNANNASADDYGVMFDPRGNDSFSVKATLVRPADFTDANFQAWGIQIGDGTQESYVKFTRASGGQLQVRWDDADAQKNQTNIATTPEQDAAARYDLEIRLDKNATTGAWSLSAIGKALDGTGAQIGGDIVLPTPIVLTDDILAALNAGKLFAGVYSTDFGTAPAFTAQWEDFMVVSNDAAPIPTVSISGAPTAVESGDAGTQTTLVFDLTYTGADATRAIDYTVNGVAASADVAFAGGLGTLSVSVENDDEDNGTDDIAVILTAVSDGDAIDAANNAATGAITEDDTPIPTVSISGAPTAVESGDAGTQTTLVFDLTYTGADATRAIDYTVNGVAASADVAFAGGLGTLSVSVENDDEDNGTDDIAVILTAVSDGDAIDAANNAATGAITEDDTPTGEPIRIQGEDFDSATNYAAQVSGAADQGQVAWIPAQFQNGTMTYALNTAERGVDAGQYRMVIGYFDENDGVSTITASIAAGGAQSFSQSWVLDETTGGNAAQASSFRIAAFDNVTVGADAVLTIEGIRGGAEHARIDYIEFIPLSGGGDPDNLPPYVVGEVPDQSLLQTETLNLDLNNYVFDPEEDALTYTVEAVDPADADVSWITVVDGVLGGTPGVAGVGVTEIKVIVSDGANVIEIPLTIEVDKVNTPPATTGIANQILTEDQAFTPIDVRSAFSDLDNDPLTYEATDTLPPGVTFTNGVFSGAPTDPGSFEVTVTASDGEAEVSSTFFFNVAPVSAGETVRIEAEDFTYARTPDFNGFFTETLSQNRGEVIRLGGNKVGEATLDLDGVAGLVPGAYDVRVFFFDENDGVSSAQLLSGDGVAFSEFASWQFDQNSGGNGTQTQNLRTLTFSGLTVEAGAVLKIAAQAQGGEFARIDYIELAPKAGAVNFAPFEANGVEDVIQPVPGPIAIDLEAIDAFGDPEENPLSYSVLSGQDWLSFNGAVLEGTPPSVAGTYLVEIGATDGPSNSGQTARTSFTITVEAGGPVNLAPTGVTVTPVAAFADGVPEGLDTTSPVKVADIAVSDDGLGTNVLDLAGDDAGLFEIVGTELFLKEGATLDASANPALDVTVTVDDVDVGATPDAQADLTLAVTEEIAPPTGGEDQIVLRINAFGPEVAATDGSGVNWLADLKDVPGTAANENSVYLDLASADPAQDRGDAFGGYTGNPALIPAGVPEAVLDTARSSNAPFSYNIPVADIGGPGSFRVNLYFAELFTGNQAVGDRVFDIGVEDQTTGVLDNFDPSVPSGGGDLRVVSYEVTVEDGVLNIDFAQELAANGGADNPIVNAIEIVRLGAPAADTTPPTAAITLTNPADADAALGVSVALSDASGIDAATLGAEDLQLSVGNVAVSATVTYLGFSGGVASYEIAAPAGGWIDAQAISVTLKAGEVADQADPANTNAATSQGLTLDIGGGSTGGGDLAPAGDLDGDGVLNQDDGDVDGDNVANAADSFAYDAQNGRLLANGEVIELDFNTDGVTPWQAGLTGLLQAGTAGAALAAFDEDTGTATVSGGRLNVIASNGDTGATNNPEDDFQVGVKNRAFTVETRVDNPFDGATTNFNQLGVHVGVDSTDFVKLVFGFAGQEIEFSVRNNDAESKVGGANIALPAGLGGLAGFEAVDLKLVVNATSATTATLQGFATFLDADRSPIAGATNVALGVATVTGALAAALFDETVGVGAGFTQTQVGGADVPFTASLDSLKVTGGAGGGVTPPDAGAAEEAFAAQDDLFTGASYGANVAGAAVLKIMEGTPNVAASNFGANSFEVENVGAKKISAFFIDVTSALYPDSVFDPDGQGGDNTAKAWAVNNDGDTGGYVGGGVGGYFLPGQDPIPNSGGSGGLSNGGYKGAMIKFNPNISGGFEFGEVVGFSGDMDPNSIAGMAKSAVDAGATQGWDVGGISGHELIGSLFTVLFDDGSTASGQLMSDKSNAGSIAIASQALTPETVSLTVNGAAAGGLGAYGVTAPTVIVTGDPGQLVRVTMSRGLDPVTNETNGVDNLVEARLARYDFKVNNAFDEQSVDVTIGANGTFDASGLFAYGAASGTGKGGFAGDTTAPIAFVASAIGNIGGDVVPVGPVTAPIYLTNQGGPVTGGPVDPPVDPIDGYYAAIVNGGSVRFKVQMEDVNANGGANPPGDWDYFTAPDSGGNQAGFQGTGYYAWKEGAVTGTNSPQGQLEYTIVIPEGEDGNYTFRVRASRDPGTASDQANDIWLKIDDDAEALQVNQNNTVSSGGFVKVFGVGTGGWGYSNQLDGEPDPNFAAVFNLSAGTHTITLAGRSGGYYADFWELYKGGTPALGASNSAFVPSDPDAPVAPVISGGSTASVLEGTTTALDVNATDANGDALTYTISGGADQDLFSINGATGVVTFNTAPDFEVPADAGANNVYNLEVTVSDGGLSDVQAYAISVLDDPADNPGGGGGGGATVRIEAENWASATNYGTQSVSHASGGTVTRTGNEASPATLTYDLSGQVAAGTYRVTIGYLDENDGQSTLTASIGSFTDSFVFDDDGPFGGISTQNKREFTFDNVSIGADSTLVLSVDPDDGEEGRIDYIDFVFLDDGIL